MTLVSIWRLDKTDNSLRKADNSHISSPYEDCSLLSCMPCTESCPFCITSISAVKYTDKFVRKNDSFRTVKEMLMSIQSENIFFLSLRDFTASSRRILQRNLCAI